MIPQRSTSLSLARSLFPCLTLFLSLSLWCVFVYPRMRACWALFKAFFGVDFASFIFSFPVPSFSRADLSAKHVLLNDMSFSKKIRALESFFSPTVGRVPGASVGRSLRPPPCICKCVAFKTKKLNNESRDPSAISLPAEHHLIPA